MKFHYLKQPLRRYTFEAPEIRKLVESYCRGRVLNLFAGHTRLSINELRVDSDPLMDADYHTTAEVFLATWNGPLFDAVILDPPYAKRKSMEMYHGNYISSFHKLRDNILRILSPGAISIELGYSSSGMSMRRGFEMIALGVICHGGAIHDTLMIVEQRIVGGLFDLRDEPYPKDAGIEDSGA